tara:strand:+ start:59 stop:574 length:516 start_codon:yes stop_codon:yes gene_type:complete
MAIEQITDVAVLVDRQTAHDTEMDTEMDTARANHGAIVDDIMGPVRLSGSGLVGLGVCGVDGCTEPQVNVLQKSTLAPLTICRCCVNAVYRHSLCHSSSGLAGEVCINCKFHYDDYGFVTGVSHNRIPLDDYVDESGKTIPGLTSRVAAGKISRDTETDVVYQADITDLLG